MEEYTVGSIADFISQTKGIKLKTKKKEKLVVAEIKPEKNMEPVKFFDKKIAPKTKKSSTKDKTERTIRKKLIKADEILLEELKQKKQKELLALDEVPSDSEEEEEEKKNILPTQKFEKLKAGKKMGQYKNFTENTIFVGNIPINYNKQKICKLFSKYGKIETARIRCVPIPDINMSKKVAALKKKFNPNRNSLVAYVKFKEKESSIAALEINGMVIDGHHLRVDLAEVKKERDNSKAVFVGGLPFNIEDDELWEFFKNCGKINSVRVIRDSHTSMGKGFGYVNFDSTAAVELALQLNGESLREREIHVKRCVTARNKNKLNAFGKKKSQEIATQLFAKRGKKLKEEKEKIKKKEKKEASVDFKGMAANVKKKKKKKLSKAVIQKKKMIKILRDS